MIVSHVKSQGEGLAKERSGHQERGAVASVVGSCYAIYVHYKTTWIVLFGYHVC